MIRVSVTDLDQLRYYRASEDMALEDLLRRLRREEPPSEAMAAGKAFHAILEHADECELDHAEQDGLIFRFALDGEITLSPIRELKAEKVYSVLGEPVELVGVVDGLFGSMVEDHKLTTRFNVDFYTDSLQWRCYLDMFQAQSFRYNIFEQRQDRDGIYVVHAYHPMTFYRYPDLAGDVHRALRDFVEFTHQYLPERLAA